MDQTILEGLLTAIRDALSSNKRQDDVALPTFDPSTSDNGAAVWCDNIDKIGEEFRWSGIAKVAKAGKALKGSALTWYETWEPQEGRTWENFRNEIISLYPEKKNLSEKLYKAVTYSSDSADSYCEYAREKIRLLKNTKIVFSESQLIEIVCGGIREVNVRMASFNSSVTTTSELIALFSAYVKTRKRPADQVTETLRSTNDLKRSKPIFSTDETLQSKTCFSCGDKGHLRSHCPNKTKTDKDPQAGQGVKKCTVCKKIGHDETTCFFKKINLEKQQSSSINTNPKI